MYARQWLAAKTEGTYGEICASTAAAYRCCVELHLLPVFGECFVEGRFPHTTRTHCGAPISRSRVFGPMARPGLEPGTPRFSGVPKYTPKTVSVQSLVLGEDGAGSPRAWAASRSVR